MTDPNQAELVMGSEELLSLEWVTRVLGQYPDRWRRKGDPSRIAPFPSKFSRWELWERDDHSVPLQEIIERLVPRILPLKEPLVEVGRAGWYIRFSVAHWMRPDDPHTHDMYLAADLVGFFGAIGGSIDLDQYIEDDDEEDDDDDDDFDTGTPVSAGVSGEPTRVAILTVSGDSLPVEATIDILGASGDTPLPVKLLHSSLSGQFLPDNSQWQIHECGDSTTDLVCVTERLLERAMPLRVPLTRARRAGCDIVLTLAHVISADDPLNPGIAVEEHYVALLADIGAPIRIHQHVRGLAQSQES